MIYFTSMMVNFKCQLSWAAVPRYLIKHYSGCFCKHIFGWDLHLTVGFGFWVKQIVLSNVAGSQTVEVQNRIRLASPEQEGILPVSCIQTWSITFGSSLPSSRLPLNLNHNYFLSLQSASIIHQILNMSSLHNCMR